MRLVLTTLIIITSVIFPGIVYAHPGDGDHLHARVIDVGAGLCVAIRMPDGHYIIYDVGFDKGYYGIRQFISDNGDNINTAPIDLLVISHNDYDHYSGTNKLIENFDVSQIWRTGYMRDLISWPEHEYTIWQEVVGSGCIDVNFRYDPIPAGTTYANDNGDVNITLVSGWSWPPDTWDYNQFSDDSEHRNSISLIVKIDYGGSAILIPGDTLGFDDGPVAAEAYMLDPANGLDIDADVLLAPHHGSRYSSSDEWISAVSPQYVIFSAGASHGHPHREAYERYVNYFEFGGIDINENGFDQHDETRLFRTDLGDGYHADEWTTDNYDDFDYNDNFHVDIILYPGEDPIVEYVHENN